jgi:hypothetical protein
MMVDPDIPPATAGGPTTELLHWMQSGLVSANTTTTIGGVKVFELINPSNTKALASYVGPSPPNVSPQTHRYTQLLLETSGASNGTGLNSTGLAAGNSTVSLAQFAMSRANFSAANVVAKAGLTVLAGNSFDVTASSSTTGIGLGNQTVPGAAIGSTTPPPASETSTSTVKPNAAGKVESGAFVAVLGVLGVAVMML